MTVQRHRFELSESTQASSDSFTISFTSFSLILLAFFIFLDAISVPDSIRKSGVVDSLDSQFLRGDMPQQEELVQTPDAILNIAKEADFEVERTGNKFFITLPGAELFESGDDQVREEKLSSLLQLAQHVADQELSVRVEGHTDDQPIATARFASNWELSTARAVSVLKIFLAHGIPANRISAAGRAEFHPIESNETEEGRAQNRRVMLIISSEGKSGGEMS